MSYLKSIVSIFLFLISSTLFAQDLIKKVPADANLLVTFNNKAFFDHLNIEDLNKFLFRAGLFKEFTNDEFNNTDDILDFGFDLDHKSYIYTKHTDSVIFTGGLIPLKDKSKFESFITKNSKAELVNGLQTVYSSDKTIRISWDDQTAYIMAGIPLGFYFSLEDNRSRFGLLKTEEAVAYSPYADAEEMIWEADSTLETSTGSTGSIVDQIIIDEVGVDSAWVEEDAYAVVDSILAQDSYDDDFFLRYDSISRHNDSIKNSFVSLWLHEEFSKQLTGNVKTYSTAPSKIDNNTLVNIYVKDLGSYYRYAFPLFGINTLDPSIAPLGINPYFNYGLEAFEGNIVVDNNALKATGSLSLDKQFIKSYKKIFSRKLNSKFYPFLDDNVLGFFSFNFDTESYLKEFPNILTNYYSNFIPRYSEAFELASMFFDTFLDEKAIGKVVKGDNLFVLNGVTKVDVNYIDYEYDDDYNYKEVEKTKVETIPEFLWMFSSDDTRIFEKTFQLGVKEEQFINHDGLYELVDKNSRSGVKLFFLIKNDMVFVGNELEKLKAIQNNSYRGKASSKYVSIIKKNPMSLLFNTKKIPVMLEELEIPVPTDFNHTVEDLSKYGDFYMFSNGIKGNKLSSEIGIEFPKDKGNALRFLLDALDNLITN